MTRLISLIGLCALLASCAAKPSAWFISAGYEKVCRYEVIEHYWEWRDGKRIERTEQKCEQLVWVCALDGGCSK